MEKITSALTILCSICKFCVASSKTDWL
uniref:Uncharacterized protein n=1 Tax=Anguilla anguilla TaxID=7936 RepID=A0A0E9PTQ3_ANGAN